MAHTFLIVDDNDSLRHFLVREIEDRWPGAEIVEAKNEKEAARRIEATLFSVVVTDIGLTDAGGDTEGGFIVGSTAKARNPDTQVVVVTSFPRPDHQSRVREMKGFSYINRKRSSPDFPPFLVNEVSDALERFEQLRGSARPRLEISFPDDGKTPIHFKLTPRDKNFNTTERSLSVPLDLLRRATTATGSLIYVGAREDCNAVSQLAGRCLWDWLFREHPELVDALGAGREAAKVDPSRFSIRILSEASSLDLPFELLHNGKDYIGLQYPIVRAVRGAQAASRTPVAALCDRNRNARVLLIAADSCSRELKSISQVDDEIASVNEVFREYAPWVEVDVLHSCNCSHEVVRIKLKERWDIIHYAGHSVYDLDNPSESEMLLWEKPCDKDRWEQVKEDHLASQRLRGDLKKLTANDLSRHLRKPPPSLFYLSCCYSARASRAGARVFSKSLGLVDSVVRLGVPAVVGYRWPVEDNSDAVELVTTFYQELLRERSLEQAMLQARKAVQKYESNWASPVMVVQDS